MKEIKFKAIRLEDGKYIYGKPFSLYEYVVNYPEQATSDNFLFPEGTLFVQFTGLKDKNGKEIYEGDIIDFDGNILLITLGEDVLTLGYKILKERDENCLDDIRLYRCEESAKIIGNKFKDPQLL